MTSEIILLKEEEMNALSFVRNTIIVSESLSELLYTTYRHLEIYDYVETCTVSTFDQGLNAFFDRQAFKITERGLDRLEYENVGK